MDVLIAFFFCMGEEQNLSNSTAFQIASPRLSNNHQENTYLSDPLQAQVASHTMNAVWREEKRGF